MPNTVKISDMMEFLKLYKNVIDGEKRATRDSYINGLMQNGAYQGKHKWMPWKKVMWFPKDRREAAEFIDKNYTMLSPSDGIHDFFQELVSFMSERSKSR